MDDPQAVDLQREVDQIRAALEHRDMIGMAKGLLIAADGCTPDEAFDILCRASMRENRKLHDIAADIVNARAAGPGLGLNPDPTADDGTTAAAAD